MRVGRAFASTMDPSAPPLFDHAPDLGMLPEERWHASCPPAVRPPAGAQKQTEGAVPAEKGGEDAESDSDAASLEAYDLDEEDEAEGRVSQALS